MKRKMLNEKILDARLVYRMLTGDLFESYEYSTYLFKQDETPADRINNTEDISIYIDHGNDICEIEYMCTENESSKEMMKNAAKKMILDSLQWEATRAHMAAIMAEIKLDIK